MVNDPYELPLVPKHTFLELTFNDEGTEKRKQRFVIGKQRPTSTRTRTSVKHQLFK